MNVSTVAVPGDLATTEMAAADAESASTVHTAVATTAAEATCVDTRMLQNSCRFTDL